MSMPEATKVPSLLKASVTTELVAEAQLDNKKHLYRHQVKHSHTHAHVIWIFQWTLSQQSQQCAFVDFGVLDPTASVFLMRKLMIKNSSGVRDGIPGAGLSLLKSSSNTCIKVNYVLGCSWDTNESQREPWASEPDYTRMTCVIRVLGIIFLWEMKWIHKDISLLLLLVAKVSRKGGGEREKGASLGQILANSDWAKKLTPLLKWNFTTVSAF